MVIVDNETVNEGLHSTALNRPKSCVLLPGGSGPWSLSWEQQNILARKGTAVAREGMRVVEFLWERGLNLLFTPPFSRIPGDYQRRCANGFMSEEPAALVRPLVPLEGAQANPRILRLSTVSRVPFLARTLPREVKRQAAEEHDALVESAPESTISGERDFETGLATPDE